jgi:YegS/Rv2252/BmrU family lipid kinase
MTVGVIANPVAGRGRARSDWPGIKASILRHFGEADFRETTEPGDARRLACAFAETEMPLVIAVGGDGTIGEVVDGLMQAAAEGHDDTALGIVPAGTGSDFARGIGLRADRERLIAGMAGGSARRIDVGRVTFVDDDGRLAARHFVNIASLGLSGPTDRRINAARRSGRTPGRALFLIETLLELLRYRFQSVTIRIDGNEPIAASVALVAVANGPCFGAGMRIAPDAKLDDGLFDIVILRGTGKLGLIRDIRLVYRGAHRQHPAITILRGRRVVVEPADDPLVNGALLDIDGESPGRIPATFEVLPSALAIRC